MMSEAQVSGGFPGRDPRGRIPLPPLSYKKLQIILELFFLNKPYILTFQPMQPSLKK